MEILENKKINLSGGSSDEGKIRYKVPIQALFVGSTCGTSLLKKGWICNGMRMEIYAEEQTLSTSCVQAVTIIGPDEKWKYHLDWKTD